MLDSNDLVSSIKKAATEAVEASKPASWMFGTVTSISPLKINVEQKMTLTSAQLVLARNVTDYTVYMSVDHVTETSLGSHNHNVGVSVESSDTEHTYSTSVDEVPVNLEHIHNYSGIKSYTVHKALKIDEEVILARMGGGQKYIVLDRVVSV